MTRTKARIKKIQAIDNKFLPNNKKFLSFTELMDSIARMFFVSTRALDRSFSMSDYRWMQLNKCLGQYMDFYRQQLSYRNDKLPKIYRLDLQTRIIQPRCYCLDVSPTVHRQGQLVLWKCNSCRRYLSFLNAQITDPLKAYRLL